ncbi:hypothetical protein M9458_033291 [Cirrhinus mrigala]|uniref:Uncharacterized protein n=1 Tax=Cirrhinus mrigala TaxID=683832 RepID=A0ABD0PG24_CIRMR
MWRILIFPPAENMRTLQLTTSQRLPPAAPMSLLPPFSRAPPSSSAQNPRTPATARSRTSAAAPQPAAALRSGPTASNMASQMCHKDAMDPYGLLSPSPPEPEHHSEPERPPEPAPPERPPEPAPPERPPVPVPPKPGPPVPSRADNTVISPKKIWGGATRLNCVLGHGSPSSLTHHSSLSCVLGYGSPSSLILHGIPDCMPRRGSPRSLTCHGIPDCMLRHGSLSSLIRPGGVPALPPVSALHEPPGHPLYPRCICYGARRALWGGGGG